ncbi:MAG: hydrogenase iron-sulfur subunit [Candidatus Odinarchaeota archaeon]
MSKANLKVKTTPPKASSKLTQRFEPRIVSFCCHYCSYGAADLAGASKMSYPTNVEIIRVPCSGRVDPLHVLRALEEGADGVMVTGCLKEQCHFVTGNIHAEKRMQQLMADLEAIGLGGRLVFELMSAGMANKWVETTSSFYDRILELGPNPLKHMKKEVKCE